MANSGNVDPERVISASDVTSSSEDGDLSDDDEIRQMKEELERIRAEKKQLKLAKKKEKLRQQIAAEKCGLKKSKGKLAKKIPRSVQHNEQSQLEKDNITCTDNRNVNTNLEITDEEVSTHGPIESSTSLANGKNAVAKVHYNDQSQVEKDNIIFIDNRNLTHGSVTVGQTENMVENQLQQTENMVDNQRQQTEDKVENQRQQTEDMVENQRQQTEDMVNNQRQQTEDMVENQRQQTEDMVENQRQQTENMVENQRQQTDDILENQRQQTENMEENQQQQTEDMEENQRQAQELIEELMYVPIDHVDFQLFMNKIGLGIFYPEKLQLSDVTKITADESARNLENIATMFIQNLITINFNCRDKMLKEYILSIPITGGKTESGNYFAQILKDPDDENDNFVNPLDLMLSVFKCSSPMLKQVLATKLFMCQLAIPLFFPAVGNDGTLVSMWPLRSLVIDIKTAKGSFQDTAVTCPCQVVSFLRFGRPTMSKSKLINEILTNQYHNTFFNKDCPLGTTKRVFGDGMIEVAWHLPSSKSSVLDKVCMFLNLRGEGGHFPEQVQFMSKISSVIIIAIETDSLKNKNFEQLIISLNQENTQVMLAIDAKKHSKTSTSQTLESYSGKYSQFEKQNKYVLLSVDGQDRSTAFIQDEMRNGISELIKEKQDISMVERLRTCGVDIDEDTDCFRRTKELAKEVTNLIPETPTATSIKERVIPLQGNLWRTWSQKNKDANKSSKHKSLVEYEQIKREMKEIRLKQIKICENLSPLMKLFLQSMLDLLHSKTQCVIFVLWLKHFFDGRSRLKLPEHLSKFQSNWQALKSARDWKDWTSTEKLQRDLDKSEYHLAEASFGFEHLGRELGQIYEALCTGKYTDTNTEELRRQLPIIAANLLLLGIPFEVMDGDVANVPLLWVKAVFSNLKNIVGDKKLLALSVLGIQSSGKSTLLNTMFGLQFAVSAGRCTRGVFLQLIRVDDNRFPFDWVLVIDTEGLRAPELGHQKYRHDNELATFVIGLSDITIINIKGENTAEVKDVLQISVHAFLRLKLANQRLNLIKSCVFIHQNVPAIDANDKMVHARQKFVSNLDVMTKEAAGQENIAEISSFNQVIEFESEKHVWYFSDLWRGDPPMCPVNPGYSEKVVNVKTAILELTTKRKTYLTVTDTISRIEDLWKGILKDDFVFSFRNSLELKAYNNIEKKCRALVWELEKSVLEFVRGDAESVLLNCENLDDMERAVPSIINRLAMQIKANVITMKTELDSFIDDNSLKEVMVQWKQNKHNRFQMLGEDLVVHSKTEINKTKEEIRFKKIRNSERTKHEFEINEMAGQLALKMKGISPTEKILKQMFDDKWSTLIGKFATTDEQDVITIKDKIESKFFEKFLSDAAFLEEAKPFDGHCYENMSKLEGTISIEMISDTNISIHKGFFGGKKESKDTCIRQTFDITNKILRKIDTTLLELNAQDKRFDVSDVTRIFEEISSDIEEYNKTKAEQYHFNLLPPYRAMILPHVLRYATVFFTRLNDEYNRKHSPKAQIQAYKGTAWELFKNLVLSKTEDVIALGFFRQAVTMTVTEHVSGFLSFEAEKEIVQSFPDGKSSLIKNILTQLAQDEDFSNIKSFIQDPRAFAEGWIIRLTNRSLFEEQSHGTNLLTRLVKKRITKIFFKLTESIKHATKNTKTSMEVWVIQFVKHSNESNGLPLSNATFVHVKNRKLPDLENFVEMLQDELEEMKNVILDSFKTQTAKTYKWKTNPVINIMDKLWGCAEVCMFCGEPCMNPDKKHINDGIPHECLPHRPEGINGVRWEGTGILDVEFCNHRICLNPDHEIVYKNVRGKAGKYKEYKTNFPDWEIEESSDISKYWMWIFFTFQNQLKDMHNAKLPSFEKEWTSISKSDAIASLG